MTDAISPAKAIKLFRSETGCQRIPELKACVTVMYEGRRWVGLYADKKLLGVVTDRQGDWAPVPLTTLREYCPKVYSDLRKAHNPYAVYPHPEAY